MKFHNLKQVFAAVVIMVALTLSGLVQEVEAAPITFSFEGTVEGISGFPAGSLPFSVSDMFSGFYTFESTASDLDARSGYGGYAAITNMQVTAGTYSASATSGSIRVEDNVELGPRDQYVVSSSIFSGLIGDPVLGLPIELAQIVLFGGTNGLTSEALPLTPPSLADFTTQTWFLTFTGDPDDPDGFVGGPLTSLSLRSPSIPEPATILLIGTGLVGLVGFRRKFRN